MMLSSVCRMAMVPFRSPVTGQNLGNIIKSQFNPGPIRSFRTKASDGQMVRRTRERIGLKDRVMEPTDGTPFRIGQAALAGASVVGIGALCYYGLGLSSEPGAVERSVLWPPYVRERVRTTFAYFGGSLILTASSAAACFRSPLVMKLMMSKSWVSLGATLAVVVASATICRSIPYTEGFGPKQLAWMAHSGVIGAVLAPFCLMGGPIILRAAWMTAGVIGGLSTIAVCAPSEKFLNMGGPLAIGLGLVFASSLGSFFLSPITALGAGLYSMSLYGGLILFSGYLMYDTQIIIRNAENHPHSSTSSRKIKPYDPVNASIDIFMDTINIFIRIAQIVYMGEQGGRKM